MGGAAGGARGHARGLEVAGEEHAAGRLSSQLSDQVERTPAARKVLCLLLVAKAFLRSPVTPSSRVPVRLVPAQRTHPSYDFNAPRATAKQKLVPIWCRFGPCLGEQFVLTFSAAHTQSSHGTARDRTQTKIEHRSAFCCKAIVLCRAASFRRESAAEAGFDGKDDCDWARKDVGNAKAEDCEVGQVLLVTDVTTNSHLRFSKGRGALVQ
eukprot:1669604-Rhodomonas_salina.1